ncbi:MAG: gamma-glutamyltransferase, partial [Planctomycetes bacterium]|nr:gamma-glutamyltransferase [Planctomycetota bacterium]
SSMSPTIVLDNGRPILALGASGGPQIISHVIQVMLNVLDSQMPLADAISGTRLHHQWKPDMIFFDSDPPADVARALEARGHKISTQRRGAVVQAIQFLDDGTMIGASDPRKGGRPAAAKRD